MGPRGTASASESAIDDGAGDSEVAGKAVSFFVLFGFGSGAGVTGCCAEAGVEGREDAPCEGGLTTGEGLTS
jgi:hypothetical protein